MQRRSKTMTKLCGFVETFPASVRVAKACLCDKIRLTEPERPPE
jgi:hypothetical protein